MNGSALELLISFFAAHGGILLVGATCLLAAGSAALLVLAAPVQRQRAAEATIAAVLIWSLLACIPLPRLSLDWFAGDAPAPTGEVAQAAAALSTPEPASIEAQKPATGDFSAFDNQHSETFPPSSPSTIPTAPIREYQQAGVAQSDQLVPPVDSGAPQRVVSLVNHLRNWKVWCAVIYLFGAVLCTAWLIAGSLLLAMLLHRAQAPPQWLLDLFEKPTGSRSRRVRILLSTACARPFSCGLWRPAIVLPAACCDKKLAPQLRHVLAHEAAHIERGDSWGRLLMNAALPLLWFHPLYWRLRSGHDLAAELLADDVAASRSSPSVYADGLLDLLKELQPARINSLGVVGVYQSRSQFTRRMEMLVTRDFPLAKRCNMWWSAGLLTVLAAVVAVSTATMGVELLPAAEPPLEGQPPAATESAATPAAEAINAAPSNAAVDGRLFVHDEVEQTVIMVDAKNGQTLEKLRVRPDAQHLFPGTNQRKFLYSPGDNKVFLIEPNVKGLQPVKLLTLKSTASFTIDGTSFRLRPIDGGLEAVDATSGDIFWRTNFYANSFATAPGANENSPRSGQTSAAGPKPADPIQAPPATSPLRSASTAWQVSAGERQVDVVALAEALVDALAEEEISSENLSRMQRLVDSGAVTDSEVRRTEVELKTAKRKIALFSAIAEADIAATRDEYSAIQKQLMALKNDSDAQKSTLSARRAQLEGRLRMLQLILDTK